MRRVDKRGDGQDAGFTLLEMLVVIAVMAVALLLLTAAGPPRSHRLEARAAAQQVAEAMREARGHAIAQGHAVTFTLPPVPGWLTVSVQAPPGGIVFAPDGSASGGQVVLDGDGQETVISADWLTGAVQIDAR
jgi:general secretion pathway protein H